MEPELLRDRYEALETAGKGGEGEVVRARDRLHDRQVALKVRPAGDEASHTRLLTEARLLLSLSPHPGLPLVREDFFVDGRYVIAMDWIEGTDLDQLLRRDGRPGLDPGVAISYLEQAAAALEHLHGHDPPVVHGDVKPANLILTSARRVVLVDFGLSSTPADDTLRAGTRGFVAPEVAAGERPTAAADVYSFAATALTLLTGEPPAGGPPDWRSIDPERVPALERILRANLAVDPARRDPAATDVAARLRRWWGGDLPRGTVSLLLADLGAVEPREAERAVDVVSRAHSGHCIAPGDDGPLLAAFAGAEDAVTAARELGSRRGARAAVATGEVEPLGGRYVGTTPAEAARLLDTAEAGAVVVDGGTAAAVADSLPADVGLARAGSAWIVVAPGLATPPRAEASPYRGLVPFDAEDGDLFFGREDVVVTVLGRLVDGGFVAVVGASGSGKSSLVRAGVVPVFARESDGSVAVVTPGPEPTESLERALAAGIPALLVVDQLEELFTLCLDEGDRAGFVDRLLDLRDGGVAVAVTLRADFYGRCAELPRLAAALAERQCLLGPMRGDELRRAIEGPAEAAGLRLEPGLVDAMLADAGREPGALPLLSHALYESWLRRDGRVLTRAGYDAAGGVRGAIARTAEEIYVGGSEGEQAAMRRLLLRLVEPGETTDDTSRRAPLVELVPDGTAGADAAAVVERLAGARLLVVGDGSAEIAHEALIREWPRLRAWLDEDREQLRALRQLTVAARAWEENGRDEADLYRGARLLGASELAGDKTHLSAVERDFLEASLDAEQHELWTAQRRARRLRVLLAVVAAALVVALLAGALALVQRGRARHTAVVAQSGRLAAQSRQVAPEHPDLALLLALEAGRLDDSADARGALLGALEHGARIRAWLQGLGSNVNAASYSPDGRLLATLTEDGTTLWDTATWRRAGPPLRGEPGGDGLAFSPDGRTLAVAGGAGHVELWDVTTRRVVRRLTDPAAVPGQAALGAVAFSPDGTVVTAGGVDTNHVTLWNVATGRVVGRPITPHAHESGVQSVAFSPDSKRIAVEAERRTVGIWDVATGRRVARLAVGGDVVEEAIYADGGRTLITSDDSGAVTFTDVATRKQARPPLSVGDSPAISLALSPDERLLAVASFDGSVHVWDVRTGIPYGAPLQADSSPVSDVAFSPDGARLVTAQLGSAVIWSMTGERAIGRPIGGERALVTGVAFAPDARWLLAGRLGGDAVVVDVATGKQLRRLEVGPVVSSVAVRPDGKLVAVAAIDGRVHLFDPRTGAAVGAPLGVRGPMVWQVAFSPDGKLLAVSVDPNGIDGIGAQKRDGEVQLWDVDARRRVGRSIRPAAGSVFALAFDGDGARLATGSYKGPLDVWDVASRTRVAKSQRAKEDAFIGVAFDPSGRLVAAGQAVGPVRVWRFEDGSPAFPPLAGHQGNVTGVSFHPQNAFLATTDLYGNTMLWDPETGLPYGDALLSERPASLEPDVDLPVLGLRNAFSPDGKVLATPGVDAHGMLWDVDPAVWRERACAIAGRNLTRAEWRLYLPGTAYRETCPRWPAG